MASMSLDNFAMAAFLILVTSCCHSFLYSHVALSSSSSLLIFCHSYALFICHERGIHSNDLHSTELFSSLISSKSAPYSSLYRSASLQLSHFYCHSGAPFILLTKDCDNLVSAPYKSLLLLPRVKGI